MIKKLPFVNNYEEGTRVYIIIYAELIFESFSPVTAIAFYWPIIKAIYHIKNKPGRYEVLGSL